MSSPFDPVLAKQAGFLTALIAKLQALTDKLAVSSTPAQYLTVEYIEQRYSLVTTRVKGTVYAKPAKVVQVNGATLSINQATHGLQSNQMVVLMVNGVSYAGLVTVVDVNNFYLASQRATTALSAGVYGLLARVPRIRLNDDPFDAPVANSNAVTKGEVESVPGWLPLSFSTYFQANSRSGIQFWLYQSMFDESWRSPIIAGRQAVTGNTAFSLTMQKTLDGSNNPNGYLFGSLPAATLGCVIDIHF